MSERRDAEEEGGREIDPAHKTTRQQNLVALCDLFGSYFLPRIERHITASFSPELSTALQEVAVHPLLVASLRVRPLGLRLREFGLSSRCARDLPLPVPDAPASRTWPIGGLNAAHPAHQPDNPLRPHYTTPLTPAFSSRVKVHAPSAGMAPPRPGAAGGRRTAICTRCGCHGLHSSSARLLRESGASRSALFGRQQERGPLLRRVRRR